METLGNKIRTLRRKQKLTQHGLADGIVTASMISQIESDRATPSPALLAHIASKLNVDPNYFETDLIDKSDELQNYRIARHYIDSGRYEEAITLLKTLSWPLSPQFKPDVVYSEMANCYLKLGNLEEACRMYECIVQVGYERNDVATSVHGYYHAGNTIRRLGRLRVARMYWQRAIDLLQQHEDIYMPIGLKIQSNLGRTYLDEGNWLMARQSYEAAISMSSRYGGDLDLAKTYQGLALACMKLKDFEMALTYNNRAIAAHVAADNPKGSLKCRINRGVIFRYAGKYEEALRNYEGLRPLISDKDDSLFPALTHEYAMLAYVSGDYETAMRESAVVLARTKVEPQAEAELRLLRAQIHLASGALELTRNEIEVGRRHLDPTRPTPLWIEYNNIQRQCWLQMGLEQNVVAECIAEVEKIFTIGNTRASTTISA
ncbi:tetratricopeptide repeat protein [Alicyclobacillus dauci]|uniref:Tetratricopeptide repeat protein n=1 Tax=Alicyclobacillus dauci TaxID=1475485 RepID=A0ABY6Z9W9_9BACL|nr:tetratricopeptide repeat protein [Alicyclobacillus dauci]WAH39059.1 tetratricopeptide repeat protein [Alicyclobacillus dauci]